MNNDLEQLKAQVAELLEWKRQRQEYQLVHPVDDVSKAAHGIQNALIGSGAGSKPLTQTISIGAGGGSATVPAAFSGTRHIFIEGSYYAVPYL